MKYPLIDFHAHILPKADHGSDCLETSLFQLSQAAAAGVDIVVATPHFYPNDYSDVESFLQIRESAVRELFSAYSGPIKILPAAEVMLCEGLHHLPDIEKLCVSGTKVILVELPVSRWSRALMDTLGALESVCGLHVVVAHIDRCPRGLREQLLGCGFASQINAEAICAFHKKQLRSLARQSLVVAIGSDIHGQSDGYKKFGKAVRLLEGAAGPLMERSQALLCGVGADAEINTEDECKDRGRV